MKRRQLLLLSSVVAVVLTFASAAYACTTVSGFTWLTNNPSSIARGGSFSASATEAQVNQTDWKLSFLNLSSDDDMNGGCHPRTGAVLGVTHLVTSGISSNGSGTISAVSATIPSGATVTNSGTYAGDTAHICFTRNNGGNATFRASVEIT